MIFFQPPERKVRRKRIKRSPPSENDEGLCMGIFQTSLNMGFIVLVFIIASTKGEWILDVIRYFQNKNNITSQIPVLDDWLPSIQWPEFKRVQSLPKFLFYSVILSVTSYNVIAGVWYWLFGSAKRKKGYGDIEEDSSLFNDAMFSSFNVAVMSIVSALLTWFTSNKGYSRLYNDVSDWGWLYFAVSVPALFLYYEVSSYYRHRTFHSPMLYKNIHFWRHRPKETTWSLMVMHPVECVAMLLQSLLPMYMFPTHIGVYLFLTMVTMYNDLMFHSSDSSFQQNHRKYKDVNFGVNSILLDWVRGTLHHDIYDTLYAESNHYNKED